MLVNWVEAFLPLTSKGRWYWGMDGKVRMDITALQNDGYWLNSGPLIPGVKETDLDCSMFHIFHNNVFKKEGIHSFCHDCYKVVIEPNGLEQVDKINKWQRSTCESLGWACKVGMEYRNYTARHWGAYFYCRGLKDGRAKYKVVRGWVDDNLGEDIPVYLKRACTEFEISMGPSDKWELLDGQLEVEEESKEVIDFEVNKVRYEVIDSHTRQKWNVWETQTQKPVTYHEEGD